MNDVIELALHHLGVLVRDIPIRSRDYEAMGYRMRSSVIHDPLQTAYVCFLSLPSQPGLLELVAPDGPESKLAQAAKMGGGLHHLCYATFDLEQSIAELYDGGALIVSNPKPAVAFQNRRISWLINRDRLLIELLELRNREAHDFFLR